MSDAKMSRCRSTARKTIIALGLVALAGNAAASELSRLFYAPGERDQLDRMRIIEGDPCLAYNGTVMRGEERLEMWMNGRTLPADRPTGDILEVTTTAGDDGRLKLLVATNDWTELRPGETLEIVSLAVSDAYRAGACRR